MQNRRENIISKIDAKCIRREPREGQVIGCLEFQGRLDGKDGYGRMEVEGETVAPHIAKAACCFGYIPRKKHVDHKCNNRLCCEETHLQIVTNKRNQILKEMRKLIAASDNVIPMELPMRTLAKTTAKKSAIKRRRTMRNAAKQKG